MLKSESDFSSESGGGGGGSHLAVPPQAPSSSSRSQKGNGPEQLGGSQRPAVNPCVFSIRVISHDWYMGTPVPEFDPIVNPSSGTGLSQVPVIRIFGTTPAGQKATLHLHRAFPYFFLPYPEELSSKREDVNEWLKQLTKAIERAVAVSSAAAAAANNAMPGKSRSAASAAAIAAAKADAENGTSGLNVDMEGRRNVVYRVSLVQARPFYGYHAEDAMFVRVQLLNPGLVGRVVGLLRAGAVLGRVFQPYESHIPFLLQLFIDNCIYGMNYVNMGAVRFRHGLPDRKRVHWRGLSYDFDSQADGPRPGGEWMNTISSSQSGDLSSPSRSAANAMDVPIMERVWLNGNIPGEWMLPPTVTRMTNGEIELDGSVTDILNRRDIEYQPNLSLDSMEEKVVQSLAAMWEEDRARRRADELPVKFEAARIGPREPAGDGMTVQRLRGELKQIINFQAAAAAAAEAEKTKAAEAAAAAAAVAAEAEKVEIDVELSQVESDYDGLVDMAALLSQMSDLDGAEASQLAEGVEGEQLMLSGGVGDDGDIEIGAQERREAEEKDMLVEMSQIMESVSQGDGQLDGAGEGDSSDEGDDEEVLRSGAKKVASAEGGLSAGAVDVEDDDGLGSDDDFMDPVTGQSVGSPLLKGMENGPGPATVSGAGKQDRTPGRTLMSPNVPKMSGSKSSPKLELGSPGLSPFNRSIFTLPKPKLRKHPGSNLKMPPPPPRRTGSQGRFAVPRSLQESLKSAVETLTGELMPWTSGAGEGGGGGEGSGVGVAAKDRVRFDPDPPTVIQSSQLNEGQGRREDDGEGSDNGAEDGEESWAASPQSPPLFTARLALALPEDAPGAVKAAALEAERGLRKRGLDRSSPTFGTVSKRARRNSLAGPWVRDAGVEGRSGRWWRPVRAPPRSSALVATLRSKYDLPSLVAPSPFWSREKDVPINAVEYGGVRWKFQAQSIEHLEDFRPAIRDRPLLGGSLGASQMSEMSQFTGQSTPATPAGLEAPVGLAYWAQVEEARGDGAALRSRKRDRKRSRARGGRGRVGSVVGGRGGGADGVGWWTPVRPPPRVRVEDLAGKGKRRADVTWRGKASCRKKEEEAPQDDVVEREEMLGVEADRGLDAKGGDGGSNVYGVGGGGGKVAQLVGNGDASLFTADDSISASDDPSRAARGVGLSSDGGASFSVRPGAVAMSQASQIEAASAVQGPKMGLTGAPAPGVVANRPVLKKVSDSGVESGKWTWGSPTGVADSMMLHASQHLTVLGTEVHVNTRGTKRPDPAVDAIAGIFYRVRNETAAKAAGVEYEDEVGVVLVVPDASGPCPAFGIRGLKVHRCVDERSAIDTFVLIVRKHDPEILYGWEIQHGSWGYLIERYAVLADHDLCEELSRTAIERSVLIPHTRATGRPPVGSGIHVTGRILLNVWRIMRSEIKLNNYTMENVVYHVLGRRMAKYSHATQSGWWRSPREMWKAVAYVNGKLGAVNDLIDSLDVLGRTSELARTFGIDFFSVLSRGSQYRVESMMLRLAKPQNYILMSPSPEQVASMAPPECIPLVMEPESRFYTSPVLVLDFQSLYPSVVISQNMCFSTTLGRLSGEREKVLGAGRLKVPVGTLGKLNGEGDGLHMTSNAVMFTRPEERAGVLPRMLQEILETRVMVKAAMKRAKTDGDKVLTRMLDARQLALKMIANVTYGYTSASFSGRMPCVDIADSIVQGGRDILERAIRTVEGNESWGARVVYGDTDSLFVLLENASRGEAFRIGNEIAAAVTRENRAPVELKFEKVFHPCVLVTKKRYVGYKWESSGQEKPVMDAKGIEIVRRDSCGAVQKIMDGALRLLFDSCDLSLVKGYVQRQFRKMYTGRVSLADFIFAKEVRLGTYSSRIPHPPAALVGEKARAADHRAEPLYGERVPYVVVAGSPSSRLIDLVVSPEELLYGKKGLRLNAVYYISKQVVPSLARVFNLLGADVNSWYLELPRGGMRAETLKLVGWKGRRDGGGGGAGGGGGGGVRDVEDVVGKKARTTIDQYYLSQHCVVCGELTELGVCKKCREDASGTAFQLLDKVRVAEAAATTVQALCRSCTNHASPEDVKCVSLDCPILYERVRTKQRVEVLRTFLELID